MYCRRTGFPLWRRPIAGIVPSPSPQGMVRLTVAAAGRSNSSERCQDASKSARLLCEDTLPRRCVALPTPARPSAWSAVCRQAFSPYRSLLEPLRISTVFPVSPTTRFRHECNGWPGNRSATTSPHSMLSKRQVILPARIRCSAVSRRSVLGSPTLAGWHRKTTTTAATDGGSRVSRTQTPRSFYVRGVPEKGLASRTSDPLSSVPQVAQATAAAGNRSLPSAVRGGGRRGLANPLRPRRAGPSGPRTEGPCGSLVGPPHPFLRDLNGSVGTDPNRKRTGTQE